MRRLGLVALAVLAACRPQPAARPTSAPSASAAPADAAQAIAQARQALERGRLEEAQERVTAGLARAAQGPVALRAELQVLDAELRMWSGDYAGVLTALADLPPDVVATVRVRAAFTGALARCRVAREPTALRAAAQALEEAEQRARALGDAVLAADAAIRRGACASTSGQPEEAEQALKRALRTARAAGLQRQEMDASGALGFLALRLERYDDAADWLAHARGLGLHFGDDLAVVKTTTNLAQSRLLLEEREQALTLFQAAAELAARRGFEYELMVSLIGSGDASRLLGRLDAAVAFLDRAAVLARRRGAKREQARIEASLAQVALARGRYAEAERLAHSALELKLAAGDVGAAAHGRVGLAQIAEARGDAEGAERGYRAVIGAADAERRARWEARARLAALLATRARPREAEREFTRAFAEMDAGRKELREASSRIAFVAMLQDLFDWYVDFLMGQGRVREALELADRSRARLLQERLGQETPRAAPARAAEFQHRARATGSVLLSYWLAPRRSYLWAVTGSGLRAHALPGEETLCPLVARHQALVQSSRDPLAEQRGEGRELFAALVGPVAAELPRGARAVLVLDGCLHQLNFETLPAPDAPARYFIEDVTLSVAPSLGVLGAARAGDPRADALLLIGAPHSPRAEFPPLAQAEREVDALRALFAPGNVSARVGAQARPTAYAAAHPERFAYVHFAAHATASRDSPLDSAVVLSPEGDDYKLYARDIVKIPLRAELVTLSACHSAGARAYAGEGLVGLAWAFLSAGARNVVAGLWNVEDSSTADLMEALYRGLRAGQAPADALRAAKLLLLRSPTAYRKPFYWAPFMVYTRAPAGARPTTAGSPARAGAPPARGRPAPARRAGRAR